MPESEGLLVIRIVAILLFLVTLGVGAYYLKNWNHYFGADPDMPSENGSARTYSKVQVIAIWVHTLLLFGAFALLMF